MTITLSSTEAHDAFDAMMQHERSWAAESRHARDSHDFDVAMSWRWHYVDRATRAAELHDPTMCARCRAAARS